MLLTFDLLPSRRGGQRPAPGVPLCILLVLGLILTTACGCEFTSANISSLKLSRDKEGTVETNTFAPGDTIYAKATVSNVPSKVTLKFRLVAEKVEGEAENLPVPGTEYSREFPTDGWATYNVTAPTRGWPAGKYRLEVRMFVESGAQKDQRDAIFTVSQGGAAAEPFQDWRAAYQRGDYATVMRLLRPLADQGQAQAQYNLGVIYDKGLGVPQDYAEAVKWYRLAAEQSYTLAQHNLGNMYRDGQGVPQDYAEAVKWYRLAAEQGQAPAQSNLGVMYATGQGVPQDYAEAVKWLRLAAEQGHAQAQHNLGFMYDSGQGVPQNDAEAMKWYRLAAEQGHADAQYNLGVMYRDGQGIPQDYVQALMWFNLAASEQATAVQGRDLAASKMTPAQIAEAQRLAREWKPKSQQTNDQATQRP